MLTSAIPRTFETFAYCLLISHLPYMSLWRNWNASMAWWCHVITFFNIPQRKFLSLLVGISNLATWKSLTLPDKGFTVSKYPIDITHGEDFPGHLLQLQSSPSQELRILCHNRKLRDNKYPTEALSYYRSYSQRPGNKSRESQGCRTGKKSQLAWEWLEKISDNFGTPF